MVETLQRRHNERHGVSNLQHIDCLLIRLFRRISKVISKFRVTGLCEWNPPVTGGIPSRRPVTRICFHLMTSSWYLNTNIEVTVYAIHCQLFITHSRLRTPVFHRELGCHHVAPVPTGLPQQHALHIHHPPTARLTNAAAVDKFSPWIYGWLLFWLCKGEQTDNNGVSEMKLP